MPEPFVTIELSAEAQQIARNYQGASEKMLQAIRRGMDRGMQYALSGIVQSRFTGQGPYPVARHELGVVTNRLRSSIRASKAVIDGNTVSAGIGTNVFYMRIHEDGADYTRTSKPGKVRLRVLASGALMRGPTFGARFAKTSHKRVKEVAFEGGKTYPVHVPARQPLRFGLEDQAYKVLAEIEAEISALSARMGGATP